MYGSFSKCWLRAGVVLRRPGPTAVALVALSSLWCRYNVRDVSFVNLSTAPYSLEIHLPALGPEELREWRGTAAALFSDSNVEAELSVGKAGEQAQAILVAPDGRSMHLGVSLDGAHETADRWSRLETCLVSPTRDAIRELIVEAHSVVLVVEGSDSEENQRVRKAAETACKDIESKLSELPKAVDRGPECVVISRADRIREQVMLFGLELDSVDGNQACAVVLVGRGRKIGPVFVGHEITATGLGAVLSVIGQSCECDLDRSWMQGPMIPLAWDSETQSRVVARLGFDAESPMVKAEMGKILSRSAGARAARTSAVEVEMEDLLLGYSEEWVEPADEGPALGVREEHRPPTAPEPRMPSPPDADPAADPVAAEPGSDSAPLSSSVTALIYTGGVLLLLAGVGAALLLRGNRGA